jgi:hypothetical protein
VSKLGGVSQRAVGVSKMRLLVPMKVFRNSVDIHLTLSKLGAFPPRSRSCRIPFELVITGVTNEDINLVTGLKDKDEIRRALKLPGRDCLLITIIEEKDMEEGIRAHNAQSGETLRLNDPKARAMAAKGLSLRKSPLIRGERVAIATEPANAFQAKELKRTIRRYTGGDVDVYIMMAAPVYSLSAIINQWVEDIHSGSPSSIARILPVMRSPREMIAELGERLKHALLILAAA